MPARPTVLAGGKTSGRDSIFNTLCKSVVRIYSAMHANEVHVPFITVCMHIMLTSEVKIGNPIHVRTHATVQ